MKPLARIALVLGLALPTLSAIAEPVARPIRASRPSDDVLRRELTPLQFTVVRGNGTERPFDNAYFDNHRAGLYVDITTGQPLFSSRHKFDSGTGWPSFYQPIEHDVLRWRPDTSHGQSRTEVRSVVGDAHLGHVFDDGPRPTGLRYCINSAALRFIPLEQLAAQGYGKYLPQFVLRR